MKDAYNFVDFADSFHPTIRFTCETYSRNNPKNQSSGLKHTRRTFAYDQFN